MQKMKSGAHAEVRCTSRPFSLREMVEKCTEFRRTHRVPPGAPSSAGRTEFRRAHRVPPGAPSSAGRTECDWHLGCQKHPPLDRFLAPLVVRKV
ncbi:hypothetical protein COLSTE_00997 [Collinsella stercoris DSM 13279]|uniref:Uncharacterized protein n=1 Tax=Collinsella stercoris DSM 13279 TaxID=445975 RepID=B6GAA1_9ACTN|nr:hypothetical protein COLSTE_00997 [Collinsella stercoris DSM 13279]